MVLAVSAQPNTLPLSSKISDLVMRPEVKSENCWASLAALTSRLAQAVPGERMASMRLAHYMLPKPTCTKRYGVLFIGSLLFHIPRRGGGNDEIRTRMP